jgi:hypothetical protein
MSGEIGLSLEREPDFFAAAAVEGPRHRTIVFRDVASGRVVGAGSRSARLCWMNGRPGWLPYLGSLRMDRNSCGLPREMIGGYDLCRDLREADEPPFCLTSIVADNRPARRLLEAGLRGMPVYRPVAGMVTLVLPVRRRRICSSGRIEISRAGHSGMTDVEALLAGFGRRHQFHPVWTGAALRSLPGLTPNDFLLATEGGHLVGCLAIWDQRRFRQSVVRTLAPRMARLRPLLNLAAPIAGWPRIPAVGHRVESAFLSHVAIAENSEHALPALVAAAAADARRRGLDCLLLGLAASGPLLPRVARVFRARAYRSVLYLVHWGNGGPAIAGLDGRTPHVEVAVL